MLDTLKNDDLFTLLGHSTLSASRGLHHRMIKIMNDTGSLQFSSYKLAALKRSCFDLDLLFLRTHVVKDMKFRFLAKKIGYHTSYESYLLTIVDVMNQEGLIESVEIQYKKFLVLKAIESTSDKPSSIWSTPCRPSFLVDLFWHSHMLHPEHYSKTCHSLIGNIINHIPGYVSKKDAKPETEEWYKQSIVFKYDPWSRRPLQSSCQSGFGPGNSMLKCMRTAFSSDLAQMVSTWNAKMWLDFIDDFITEFADGDSDLYSSEVDDDEFGGGYEDCG